MGSEPRRASPVGPVLLITIGLVFLLNNLGYLSWDVWRSLIRLWPLLLIAWGIDLMIGRRSRWGWPVSVVLVLALFVGGFLLLDIQVTQGQRIAGETIRQALQGAEEAEVRVAPLAGWLRLGGGAASDSLIEGRVPEGRGQRVDRSFALNRGVAEFSLQGSGVGFFSPADWGLSQEGRPWDLRLNEQIPLRLKTDLVAGKADLDLRALKVRELQVTTVIGATEVVLPATGNYRAKVEGAIGEVVVLIPSGLAARIEVSAALASQSIEGAFEPEGSVYVSPDYESAADRVNLRVSMPLGSIVIRPAPK